MHCELVGALIKVVFKSRALFNWQCDGKCKQCFCKCRCALLPKKPHWAVPSKSWTRVLTTRFWELAARGPLGHDAIMQIYKVTVTWVVVFQTLPYHRCERLRMESYALKQMIQMALKTARDTTDGSKLAPGLSNNT
jgi:hypothetical protein